MYMNIKLLKAVVKKTFHKIRQKKNIFCTALNSDIVITRDIWEHLLFRKRRSEEEVYERFLILILLEDILRDGSLAMTRDDQQASFHEIDYLLQDMILTVIILQKNNRMSVASCFKNNKKRPV